MTTTINNNENLTDHKDNDNKNIDDLSYNNIEPSIALKKLKPSYIDKDSELDHHKNLQDQDPWDDSELINAWEKAASDYKRIKDGEKIKPTKVKDYKLSDTSNNDLINSNNHKNNLCNLQQKDFKDVTSRKINIKKDFIPNKQKNFEETENSHYDSHTHKDQKESINGFEDPKVNDKSNSKTIDQAQPEINVPVDDVDLKNTLLAWYYAGYYTGLYQASKY